ncbi:hypothetical protein DH2020_014859 [Rehmannia glutinosa]|uniref:RING-type E3 ubiquitin transferase n=1 Tax=Rehmannia glutinosa TaxID=99300 RepID=A0ABR0X164_REHGL
MHRLAAHDILPTEKPGRDAGISMILLRVIMEEKKMEGLSIANLNLAPLDASDQERVAFSNFISIMDCRDTLRSSCARVLPPQQATAQECRMLIEYVMMNAVAMRKILKKYDKVHGSVNGRKFKSKMRSEHMEILQSPWLIELGAFYMNISQSNGGNSDEQLNPFSFDLTSTEPTMTLLLPDSEKLEYSLTCAICLELVFNPYALSCGHLFCKSCVCSAASVMIFQGPKDAPPESKCPVCRSCKEYWKERLLAERAEMVKQSKIYWELQTKYMIGY